MAGQRRSTLHRSLHHYMISTAESLPSLSASTPSSNNNDRTSAERSTASSTALPTQPPPGYSTPLTTSRMGNIPSPPGSFPRQDPPTYSPETNWDELHARSILWRAIERYFASLPPLATTKEMDLERQRHLLLLWEATNDRHALESRALLGLPPWATTGQVAWRLFVDLLQSRSFPERILNEPELSGERMQTLFPNGYCERCVAEMTMNAMRRASISAPSHRDVRRLTRLEQILAADADRGDTGYSTVRTIVAQLAGSVNRAIWPGNAGSTSSIDMGERCPLQMSGTALTRSSTTRRTRRLLRNAEEDSSRTTNA